jgi:hypothetical protein
MRVGDPAPKSFDGKSAGRSALEFALLIGAMTWLTRTNLRFVFAVQDSAQYFAHYLGPLNFVAARRVLAHLRKDTTQGLTFQGSGEVLNLFPRTGTRPLALRTVNSPIRS